MRTMNHFPYRKEIRDSPNRLLVMRCPFHMTIVNRVLPTQTVLLV